jgi:tyrosinase
MENTISRRRFIGTTVGATISTTLIGSSFFDPPRVLASPSHVRRDVRGMTSTDPILVSYSKAIESMRALDITNPLSWCFQAAIHGTIQYPALPTWNQCEHSPSFFWPWHRMYLYWFERIVRKMADDPCWTLPYWNYTDPLARFLPAPFRDPGSALCTKHRDPAWNSGRAQFCDNDVDYTLSLTLPNYMDASQSIFQSPHSNVHTRVGGEEGWMTYSNFAALDPIFFVHHSNIDRLWNIWLTQCPEASDPLSNNVWKDHQWIFFDEDGHKVVMTTCEVLRAQQQLGYSYEGETAQRNQDCQQDKVPYIFTEDYLPVRIPAFELRGGVFRVTIDLDQTKEKIANIVTNENQTLFLVLDNVETDRAPQVIWDVFAGFPPGAAPDSQRRYFVGTLALFACGIQSLEHHTGPAHFAYPISRAIATGTPSSPDRIAVAFVARGAIVDGQPTSPEIKSPLRVGQARLMVETKRESK